MDKNRAIIEYLYECPTIAQNPLFFNFAEANDNNKQLITTANDKRMNKQFVDGSELKRFTFTIIDYRSVIYQALVNIPGYENENVEELFDVQSIINWIEDQNDAMHFPDFGPDCVVERITTLTDNPNLNGVDTKTTPALAKYSMAIQVDYLDTSKVIWNK